MDPLRSHYLKEMGVDVWVLRGRKVARQPVESPGDVPASDLAGPGQAVPETRSTAKEDSGAAPSSAGAPATPAAPPPEFHLCFMHFQQVSLVFSVPWLSDQLPVNLGRLAEDIAFAWAHERKPSVTNLRWPLVRADHMDQSPEAARVVLRQRIERCASTVLAFGEEARQWISPERACVELEDLQTYLDEPLKKRDLWRRLKSLGTPGK